VTATKLRSLDPEQVAKVWFKSAEGPVEVSLDGGLNWLTLTTGTDPDGATAQYIIIAGPDVDTDELDPAAVVLTARSTQGISRVVDEPQITPSRWRIDLTRPPGSSGTYTPQQPLIVDGGNA
jgi:hypothetical protein